MLKYILNRFFNKKQITTDTQHSNHDNANHIMLFIDDDGEPTLKINIGNYSQGSAEKFAKALFLLNEGYYIKAMLDILAEISHADQYTQKFVKDTIMYWSKEIAQTEAQEAINTNDSPIISPTAFSNSHSIEK